mmetsp:Transcript_30822/g.42942  ORF Transcript_30822/g.42942 Transcript_30822/m.42942 type:complete len:222 (+) Transcript_30822:734-1399(+)
MIKSKFQRLPLGNRIKFDCPRVILPFHILSSCFVDETTVDDAHCVPALITFRITVHSEQFAILFRMKDKVGFLFHFARYSCLHRFENLNKSSNDRVHISRWISAANKHESRFFAASILNLYDCIDCQARSAHAVTIPSARAAAIICCGVATLEFQCSHLDWTRRKELRIIPEKEKNQEQRSGGKNSYRAKLSTLPLNHHCRDDISHYKQSSSLFFSLKSIV